MLLFSIYVGTSGPGVSKLQGMTLQTSFSQAEFATERSTSHPLAGRGRDALRVGHQRTPPAHQARITGTPLALSRRDRPREQNEGAGRWRRGRPCSYPAFHPLWQFVAHFSTPPLVFVPPGRPKIKGVPALVEVEPLLHNRMMRTGRVTPLRCCGRVLPNRARSSAELLQTGISSGNGRFFAATLGSRH